MKTVIAVLCLSLLFCNPTPGQEKTVSVAKSKNLEAASELRENANPAAANLPVRRVVLYKNGVGYFEHLGHVRGSQDVHVDFTTTSEDREKKTYIVRNEDSTPRTLVIEHPARPEWKLREDDAKPEEKAAGLYRFRLGVEAKKTERLVVNEAKPLYSQYALNGVTNEEIDLLLRRKSINADIEKSLRTITAQKKVVADFDGALKDQQKAMDQIFTDQARLRENMKALKGSAEERTLLQRYTKQLDEEETQLDAIRRTKQDTEVQQKLANSVLQNMIQELQMDVTL